MALWLVLTRRSLFRQEIIRRWVQVETALCLRLERAREEGDLPRASDCAALATFVVAVGQDGCSGQGWRTAETLHRIVDQVLVTWPSKKQSFSTKTR
jgi:hypothetical protein